jgi:hypothetical protein
MTAGAAAEDSLVSLEISCVVKYPGLQVTIFTDEPFDPGPTYSLEVPISVMTDGRQQPGIYGSSADRDGELVVMSDTQTSNTLASVLGAMAASRSTIKVQFKNREYHFSPAGLADGMRYLKKNCP